MNGRLKTERGNTRPNRLARGMQNTWDRNKLNPALQRSQLSDDALGLVVNGTLDKIGRAWYFITTRVKGKICPCCGQHRPRLTKLNDQGRGMLSAKKRRQIK